MEAPTSPAMDLLLPPPETLAYLSVVFPDKYIWSVQDSKQLHVTEFSPFEEGHAYYYTNDNPAPGMANPYIHPEARRNWQFGFEIARRGGYLLPEETEFNFERYLGVAERNAIKGPARG